MTKAQTALRRAHCLASHRVDVVRGVNFRASADEQLMRAILRAGHKHLVDVVVVAHRCFGRRIQGTGERLHRCSDTDRGSDAWMRPNESGWGSTHTFQHFIDLAGGRALHEVCADRQLRGGTQVAHLLLCSKQTNKKAKKTTMALMLGRRAMANVSRQLIKGGGHDGGHPYANKVRPARPSCGYLLPISISRTCIG